MRILVTVKQNCAIHLNLNSLDKIISTHAFSWDKIEKYEKHHCPAVSVLDALVFSYTCHISLAQPVSLSRLSRDNDCVYQSDCLRDICRFFY